MRAANTPFRHHKMWVHEGCIATPLIVHLPAGIAVKGELRHAVGHVIDLAPTILRLAGGSWPTKHDGIMVPPHPGRNLAVTFRDDAKIDRQLLWWFYQGNKAIRVDDWKLVAAGAGPWELYDLAQDRAANQDLEGQNPEKVKELQQRWRRTAEEFQVIRPATSIDRLRISRHQLRRYRRWSPVAIDKAGIACCLKKGLESRDCRTALPLVR